MNKSLRISLYAILVLILLFLITLIVSNILIKNKLEAYINNQLPETINASYDALDLHLLKGTLTFTDVSVTLKNKSDKKAHTFISGEKVVVEELSYWEYLLNNQIHIEDIKLKFPKITYFKDKLVQQKTDDSSGKGFINLYKPILVDEVSIDNAKIAIYDSTKDSTLLYVPNITIEVDDVYVDKETLSKRLPFKFGDYDTASDSIFLKVSPFENLTVGNLAIKNNQVQINDIQLSTKYTKAAYAGALSKEKDHFNVTLKDLDVNGISFGFTKRKFFFNSTSIIADTLDATIYRNKLIANDPSKKPLYSKMLRDLPIYLTIDSVMAHNSTVTYEEKVKADQPAGSIYFENLDLKATQVSNTYPEGEKTNVAVTSLFMKMAPLEVGWEFDVNNTNDDFTFKADLGHLDADQMNVFTKPNLLVSLEGEVDKTYFSIYGNSTQSKIDMRIDYDNFKVELLKDNGKKKSKLLSGIINIFVKKDSNDNQKGFSKGTATITRDNTKSFFNYVWLNVRDALKDCLL